jgi:uncharacterized protein
MLNDKPVFHPQSKPRVLSDSPTWYRNPYCWLVLAGPIAVVIAGLITLWIAVSGADTLVDQNYYQKGLALSNGVAINPSSLQPARAARNHAATGGTPQTMQQSSK